MSKEKLQKEAQELLAEARRLLLQAGELAKQGQFTLTFNAGGSFIPSSLLDPATYRDEAIRALEVQVSDWNSLDVDAREEYISDYTADLIADSGVPYEFREQGYDKYDGDRWWRPSSC